jgi:hypothetical protein
VDRTRDAQLEIWKLLGSRIDQEHGLITGRMTWLMTLNGLLTAAIGVVFTAGIRTANRSTAILVVTAVVALATLGAMSNWSVLYSHYWASRAIKEAELAARWALDLGRLAQPKLQRPEAMFRLFGRDPKMRQANGMDLRASPWHPIWPPNRLVHPWFFLPILGAALFPMLAITFRRLPLAGGTDYEAPWLFSAIPAMTLAAGVALFFAGRIKEVLDRRE